MSELRNMIAESVQRLFSEQVDRKVLDSAESGSLMPMQKHSSPRATRGTTAIFCASVP